METSWTDRRNDTARPSRCGRGGGKRQDAARSPYSAAPTAQKRKISPLPALAPLGWRPRKARTAIRGQQA